MAIVAAGQGLEQHNRATQNQQSVDRSCPIIRQDKALPRSPAFPSELLLAAGISQLCHSYLTTTSIIVLVPMHAKSQPIPAQPSTRPQSNPQLHKKQRCEQLRACT